MGHCRQQIEAALASERTRGHFIATVRGRES